MVRIDLLKELDRVRFIFSPIMSCLLRGSQPRVWLVTVPRPRRRRSRSEAMLHVAEAWAVVLVFTPPLTPPVQDWRKLDPTERWNTIRKIKSTRQERSKTPAKALQTRAS